MKPSRPRIGLRLLTPILAFLSIAAASAWAAPAGIYTISRIIRHGGIADGYYQRLSGDGSIVLAEFPANSIWSYPDGPGELFPNGISPLMSIGGASPDMSILLGQGSQGGWVVATRDGSRVTQLEPANVAGVSPTALSPNGRYAAGKTSLVGPAGLQPDVGRWRVGETYQSLPRLPDFAAANVVSVNDEGVVYGHGYVAVPSHPSQTIPGLQLGAAVRWQPDGTLERLAGTDDLGRGWRQQRIDAISPDGSSRLGGGFVEREAASGTGFEEVSVQAVFDDAGARWVLWDGRDPNAGRPYRLGISADGSRVFGHVQEFRTTPVFGFFDVPRIYSPDGSSVDFEVFLQSMGLDTSNWQLGSIIDMSDDGKTFLAFGSEIGGNGYQVLIVIPEPGTAMLLGLGLVGLSRVRTRGPLARSPS